VPTKRFPLSLPLLVVVVSWGFNFLSLKVLYANGMKPLTLMFDRAILMGILLAGICLVRRQPLKYPGGRDTWLILLSGFISMGLYMMVFLVALQMTSPAEGAVMLAMAPVFTYILSCLARQEAFIPSAMAGSVVGFAGVATVILGGAHSSKHGSLEGNLVMLASAFIWAVGVVILRPVLHRHDAMRLFTLSIPGALPILLGFGLLPAIHTDYGAVTPLGWLMFAQIVLLSGVVAFVCFYVGIHQIGPSRATMYQFFIPPTAAMFQWLFFGDTLNGIQWLGLTVLIAGVFYSSYARTRSSVRKLGHSRSNAK
jgi:drug/metabolite transporter (DMT)-like permease